MADANLTSSLISRLTFTLLRNKVCPFLCLLRTAPEIVHYRGQTCVLNSWMNGMEAMRCAIGTVVHS